VNKDMILNVIRIGLEDFGVLLARTEELGPHISVSRDNEEGQLLWSNSFAYLDDLQNQYLGPALDGTRVAEKLFNDLQPRLAVKPDDGEYLGDGYIADTKVNYLGPFAYGLLNRELGKALWEGGTPVVLKPAAVPHKAPAGVTIQ
jgi:hypothetical protein